MKTGTTCLIPLLVALIAVGCSQNSDSEPEGTTPSLLFSPAQTAVRVNQEATIQLVAGQLPAGIFAMSLRISFPPEKLSFGEQAVALGNYFHEGALVLSESSDSLLYVAVSEVRGSESAGGSGTIFMLTLRGVSAGAARLSIDQDALRFYDQSGNGLPVDGLEVGGCSLTVTE